MENKDQTRQMLEKAHRLNPKDEWYAFALANVYMADKHINEAIQLYEGLIRHRPDNENLLFQLAALYGNTGGFKKAIETLDQVERLIGKNEQVSLEKYKYYKALGKPAKAIREIEALSESLPYDVDTRILLGDAWMDLGKPDKAYAIYMEAKQMDPENPSIYLSLADYYTEMGDTATASKQLHLALTNPNTDVTTKLNILTPIMTSSLKSGDSLTVDKYFAMLLEQHPNEYQIRDLYVQWLLQTNRKVEAKQELRTVLDLNPTNLKAWRNYLELNLEYDKQYDIRRICQEALTNFPK
jgi:predicted Zn-dependent protease